MLFVFCSLKQFVVLRAFKLIIWVVYEMRGTPIDFVLHYLGAAITQTAFNLQLLYFIHRWYKKYPIQQILGSLGQRLNSLAVFLMLKTRNNTRAMNFYNLVFNQYKFAMERPLLTG